jgi:hypothetical protein
MMRARTASFCALSMIGTIVIGGCGSSSPSSPSTVPEAAPQVAVTEPLVDTTSVATGAASAAAAVAGQRLADDSPTCTAIRKVKDLNDAAGALTSEFSAQIFSASNASDSEAVQKAFNEYIAAFREKSKVVIPQLTAAYDVLINEQPQFSEQLTNLKEVTVVAVDKMGELEGADLDTVDMEKFFTDAVPKENLVAAGNASLEIDKFSMTACELPFANR